MNKSSLPHALLFSATVLLAGPLGFAAEGHNHSASAKAAPAEKAGQLIPVTEKDAVWAAKARQNYPLDVCLVSDEKLGSMGKSPEYIYRVDGKADRFVVFCCDGCEGDFLHEPAKHLAKLAAAAKSAPAPKADAPKGHGEHKSN